MVGLTISIDEDTHRRLQKVAQERGESVECLAENAVEEAALDEFRHREDDPAKEDRFVTLIDYRWGDRLYPEDRARLLQETREALDDDPATPETSADIPDDISDADLFIKWLRS